MSNAQFVGRVGGLAVALGIGLAIASTAGVAAADTDSASASESPSTKTASPSDSAKDSAEPDSAQSSDDPDTDDDAAGDDTEADDVAATQDESDALDDDSSETAGGPRGTSKATFQRTKSEPEPEVDQRVDDESEPEAVPDTKDLAPLSAPESNLPEATAKPVPEPVQFVRTVILQVLSFALSPVLGPPPSIPNASVGTVVQAWLRRELTNANDHDAPVVRPSQLSGTDLVPRGANGSVIGTLNAVDPDGHRLVYRISQQPLHGTVTISKTGEWTYTPSSRYITSGVRDSFVVDVADTSLAMRLANVENVTSVTVDVDVPEARPQATRGFDVFNLSNQPMTLSYQNWRKSELGYRWRGGFGLYLDTGNGKPPGDVCGCAPQGAVLQPGESAHFELTGYISGYTEVNLTATGPLSSSTIQLSISWKDLSSGGKPSSSCTNCAGSGTTKVMILDAPGTVIRIPAGQGQKQADVLNRLCYNGSGANCEFKATGTKTLPLGPRAVANGFSPIINDNDFDQAAATYTVTETFTNTDTVEVSPKASGKIFDLVSIEVSGKYGHTWTDTKTYTQVISAKIPAHSITTIWVQRASIVTTGDFILTQGGTTWILEGVEFTYGDRQRREGPIVTTVESRPWPAASECIGGQWSWGFDLGSRRSMVRRVQRVLLLGRRDGV